MLEFLKDDLRQLTNGKPGSRFCDFYDFRQRHRNPGFSVARMLTILLGLVLTVGGASIGWLPGPGGFVAIFGLALLAQEFRPMAVALDWCEPKLRVIWNWLAQTWKQMSSVTQVALATTFLVTSATVGFAAYKLFLQ